MAISVLDVRSSVVPARVSVSSPAPAVRRLPVAVVAAAALGVIEAVGLLAVGFTGLDSLLASGTRPHGAVVGAAVLLLSAWVVLSAGSGVALVDGTGRRLVVAIAHAELAAVAAVVVAAVAVPLELPTPAHLPPAAVVVLALAVPVAKLLLAGTPSVQAWIAAGPRVRERRPDPVARHRTAAALTLAVIGLALGAVAVGGPQPDGPGGAGAALTTVVADR
jgi:hypothetical protein